MTPANPYAADATRTASPARLVTMLYDRLLTAFARSRIAIEAGAAGGTGDLVLANAELQRAQDILDELRHTLDHDAGGEVATNLDALYAYCTSRVITANLRKEPAGIVEAEQIISGIREAWVAACDPALAPVAG